MLHYQAICLTPELGCLASYEKRQDISPVVNYTQRYSVASTTYCPECDMTRGIIMSERSSEAAKQRSIEASKHRSRDGDGGG
jgi:hypothetical protein